jgi:hypothetical protein
MTNPIALVIFLIVGGIFAADFLLFHWDLHIQLGRGLILLLEYLAVWR